MVYFARIEVGTFSLRWYGRSSSDSDHPRRMEFIKIGTSIAPAARVKYLQWEYAKPMILLAVMPGGRPEEIEMHRRFAHLRLKGYIHDPEWFYPVPELMEYIRDLQENPENLPGGVLTLS